VFRLVVALVVAATLVAPGGSPPSTFAKGEDVCPEPNDDFQSACFLGTGADALGFISNENDIDAYRFEVYDFNSTAHVEIADQPVPYQFVVADWNGEEIGRSQTNGGREIADVALQMPGSYYVFVQTRTGQFSDGAPYRISTRIDYVGAAPRPTYRGDFRAGENDEGDTTREAVDFIRSGGKLTIVGKVPGSKDAWAGGTWWLGDSGDDFTITFDSRIQAGSSAGYRLQFGGANANAFENVFTIIVDASNREAVLGQYVGREYRRLAGWAKVPTLAEPGRVNRTTVDVRGGVVKLFVNKAEVLSWEGKVPPGKFAIGSASWDDPATVSFDNVLATAPGGTAASGTVLASDNFDDPNGGILATTTQNPDEYTRTYEDGQYAIRLKTAAADGQYITAVLPFDYTNATLGIDGRILQPWSGAYLSMQCRLHEIEKDVWGAYTTAVYPEAGVVGIRRSRSGSQLVTLAEQRNVGALKKGTEANRIEMTCAGNTISVSINGTPVVSATDDQYQAGALVFGFGAQSGGPQAQEARFDNMVVTQR
jgi:hypothetical protein